MICDTMTYAKYKVKKKKWIDIISLNAMLLHLMNCGESTSKVLGCYFCDINWYLLCKGKYLFVLFWWMNIILIAILTNNASQKLPHKIAGQSHILPIVFQCIATKHPSNNNQAHQRFRYQQRNLGKPRGNENIWLI
jgi:hypothetical protein